MTVTAFPIPSTPRSTSQAYEAMDADADGVPDALDAEVGPERESLMTSTLTNVANMKHESLKGIAQNLRG
ncbi:MAG: hypothetical protein E6I94_01530 [Chloroflexi bacterium]|nr:MAG: hypothetical protein E6I94_01530 [Chloroflexota bacterium]